jgi:hypothetical protein
VFRRDDGVAKLFQEDDGDLGLCGENADAGIDSCTPRLDREFD